MPDDFDFEYDFKEPSLDSEEEGGSEEDNSKLNPVKKILKKILDNNLLKIIIPIALLLIIIIVVIVIVTQVNQSNMRRQELVSPQYYTLPEYRIWLDQEIDGYRALVLIQLELVFNQNKDFAEELDSLKFQIQDKIVNEFVPNMNLTDIKDRKKREKLYEDIKRYINLLTGRPNMIKEISEVKFEPPILAKWNKY